MPKVEYTESKGLVQKTGTGFDVTGATKFNNNVNRGGKSRDRYYLEEYFAQRPAVNADIAQSHSSAAEQLKVNVANKNFEILGTNASTDDVTFSATHGGLQL